MIPRFEVETAAEMRVAGLGDAVATERGGESFARGGSGLGSLPTFRFALHSTFRRLSQILKLPLSCVAVGNSRGHVTSPSAVALTSGTGSSSA